MRKDHIEAEIKRNKTKDSNYFLGMIGMLMAVVILWLAWGLGGAQFFADFLCKTKASCDQVSTLGAIGDIFGGVNALFAAIALVGVVVTTDLTRKAYKEDRQWTRDEKFVEQVKMSYEWAFNVLTDNGTNIPPLPSRLNWLTCARHLIRAKRIAAVISTPAFATLMEEHEEYWRHRFYTALDSLLLRDWKYYAAANSVLFLENIEITSAMVVLNFSNWSDDAVDPTDEVDRDDLEKDGNCFSGRAGYGLKEYIVELKKDAEKRRKSRE